MPAMAAMRHSSEIKIEPISMSQLTSDMDGHAIHR